MWRRGIRQPPPTPIRPPDQTSRFGRAGRVSPLCRAFPQAVLGDHCELGAGVHIYGRSTLGARNVLRAGAVVGSDDPGCTVLGDGNTLGHHALVGVKCQVRSHSYTGPPTYASGVSGSLWTSSGSHLFLTPRESRTVQGCRTQWPRHLNTKR